VAIWQHRKRVLGIFSHACAEYFRSKIWARHSLQRPRFPIRQMHFHYRVTFTGHILCFGATTSHDLVTLTFDLLTFECIVYSASHVRPTYQFLLSYDYRLLSYEYWYLITFPLSETVTVHAPCHVTSNRGQNMSTILKSLTPICLFTLSLSRRYDED